MTTNRTVPNSALLSMIPEYFCDANKMLPLYAEFDRLYILVFDGDSFDPDHLAEDIVFVIGQELKIMFIVIDPGQNYCSAHMSSAITTAYNRLNDEDMLMHSLIG